LRGKVLQTQYVKLSTGNNNYNIKILALAKVFI
jgi:hypothetical protein